MAAAVGGCVPFRICCMYLDPKVCKKEDDAAEKNMVCQVSSRVN